MAVPFILYAIGVQLFRIAATQAGKKVAARLVAGGAKKVTQKVATKMGGAPTTITARNVAGVLKNVRGAAGKQPKGGVVRPKAGSTKTTTKPQQGPGGVTIKPSGGKIVRPKAGSTKPPKKDPKTKPPKKDPKSPFAKKTAKEKAAAAAKLKKQLDAMKKPNRAKLTGRFDKKGAKITNVPKTGSSASSTAGGIVRKGKLLRGGSAILLGSEVLKLKGDTPQFESAPRQDTKVTPKTGQGRPSLDKNKNKRKIPVVKPKEGPMKVRPKESDQPKKGMTFGQAFNDARRKKKQPTFTWENPKTGKTGKYTTRLKEESIADHKKKFNVTGKY